jgi:hypothetical protein
MKVVDLLLVGIASLLLGNASASQVSTPVAARGETTVSGTFGKLSVQVRITTHELQIGRPSDTRPAVNHTNCTYSKYPCSIVDSVDIIVNGHPLFVPRSVFCDLADLNKATIIKATENQTILRLDGGDGSEGYIVNIEFDGSRVKRRTLSSGTLPEQPLQETTYHVVTEG